MRVCVCVCDMHFIACVGGYLCTYIVYIIYIYIYRDREKERAMRLLVLAMEGIREHERGIVDVKKYTRGLRVCVCVYRVMNKDGTQNNL